MKRVEKNNGFTLLEVMFVIIILSVTSLFTIKFVAQRDKVLKVQRTAIEMQNIQQAAAAYYLENNQWPQKLNQLLATDDTLTDGILHPTAKCSEYLMPGGADYDPLICGDRPIYQIQAQDLGNLHDSKYLEVFVEVPTAEIARQIAAMLPDSYTKLNMVYSSVSRPGYQEPDRHSLLIRSISMQYANKNGVDIPKPKCPEGWKQKVAAGISMIFNQQGADDGWRQVLGDAQVYPIKFSWIDGESCDESDADDLKINRFTKSWRLYTCTYPSHRVRKGLFGSKQMGEVDKRGLALTITYCEPPNYDATEPY